MSSISTCSFGAIICVRSGSVPRLLQTLSHLSFLRVSESRWRRDARSCLATKMVSPPELPTEPAGGALTSKEVRYLLSGPDREKAEGARDYALMLVVLRLSLRVSEVCSLKSSSMEWSRER